MKQSKSYKISMILLLLFFAVSVSCCLVAALRPVAAETNNDPSFSEIELEDSYAKGTELSVPQVIMTLNGQNYVTQAVLHNPYGSAEQVYDAMTLDVAGVHTLEYKATVGGVTYSYEDTFSVYQPKYEFTSSNCKAEYSTTAVSGMEGEYISLAQDETLIIRDYFDITQATISEPIFEASIIPAKVGAADFERLTVRFVSKNDPSQYLEVVCNYYTRNNNTYYQAGANTQTVTGYEANGGTLHVGNTWGSPQSGCFNGTYPERTVKFYLDYETKTVYAGNAKGFVIDLDDPNYFGTLWEGFENGGEVYVEVEASTYTGINPAQFLLTRVGDIDLTQQNVYDTQGPEITIDFGEYSEENIPVGVAGKAYPIFSADAVDFLSGDCDVSVHVWARYYTSQKYEVDISDGSFVPQTAGEYIIEYSAEDASGNIAVKRISVNVLAQTNPISITFADQQTSGKTGEKIAVSEITATGGAGVVNTQTEVLFAGTPVEVVNGSFLAERAGQYTVRVTGTDYIGQQQVAEYTVTVTANDAPVFIDDIVLPKYLIAGSEYTFGEVYAYDYSSGSGGTPVKATLVTEDVNGKVEHADGKYTPSVADHLDKVKVYYTASVNGQTATSEVFEIETCVVGTGNKVDISKYFVSDAVGIEATAEGMRLSTTQSSASVDFANPVLANGLTYTFNVDPSANSFTAFNIYLYDSLNAEECVKLSYKKATQSTSYMSLNDGTDYTIPASFFGNSSYEFAVSFNNKTCVFSYETSVRLTASKTMNGDAFTGFSSGKVYVVFEFEGVTQTATVVLSELGGQRMTSVSTDLIKPKIDLFNEIAGRYSIGDVVDLTAAVAVDVLDPNIQAFYTVYAPSGEIAKDVDGKELSNIPVGESYKLALQEYGVYRVGYTATDWNDRAETTFSYVLEVVDAVPPVIILNGEVPAEATVGDTVSIPLARATDLLDGSCDVYAYFLRPDGSYRAYNSGMTYEMQGDYTLIYYAFDTSGNTAKITYTISVK